MSWIEDLKYSFEGFELNVPRWDFPDSGISCIFGASGSGKTSMLQIMAGLLQAPHKLCVNGDMVSEISPREKNIGFVFQDYALFPHMTVYENLAFVGESKKLFYDMWKDQAERLLDKLNLGHLKNQKAQTLSGGEQQRVALARALVTKPRMVFLDEPLSALDESLRDDARDLIKLVAEEFKVPFILVTHDLRDVRYLSDAILVLKNGLALGSGATSEILAYPPTLEVAQAIPENQILNIDIETGRPSDTITVAKPWSFKVTEKVTGLSGEIVALYNEGPHLGCRVRLSSGQILKAVAPLSLKNKGKVNLEVDPETLKIFKGSK